MDILLVFLKNPIPGKVKTRLARTVGDEEAVRIYRFLVERALRATAEAPVDRRWLFYAEGIPVNGATSGGGSMEQYHQCAGDLGQRMADAFGKAFAAGATRVVIIGSDCPELSSAHLRAAFDALGQSDLVIGPTLDGGYYLLGLNRFENALFEHIAWSTSEVFAQTLAVARQKGLTYCQLPTLADIDTEADWKAYLKRSQISW